MIVRNVILFIIKIKIELIKKIKQNSYIFMKKNNGCKGLISFVVIIY